MRWMSVLLLVAAVASGCVSGPSARDPVMDALRSGPVEGNVIDAEVRLLNADDDASLQVSNSGEMLTAHVDQSPIWLAPGNQSSWIAFEWLRPLRVSVSFDQPGLTHQTTNRWHFDGCTPDCGGNHAYRDEHDLEGTAQGGRVTKELVLHHAGIIGVVLWLRNDTSESGYVLRHDPLVVDASSTWEFHGALQPTRLDGTLIPTSEQAVSFDLQSALRWRKSLVRGWGGGGPQSPWEFDVELRTEGDTGPASGDLDLGYYADGKPIACSRSDATAGPEAGRESLRFVLGGGKSPELRVGAQDPACPGAEEATYVNAEPVPFVVRITVRQLPLTEETTPHFVNPYA